MASVMVSTTVACAPPASTSELAQASETIVEQSRFIVNEREFNTCNGEVVRLSGEVHMVITEKATTLMAHVNGHLTGVGSHGNEYLLNLQGEGTVQPGGQVVTFAGRELLISKGGAPNQLVTVSMTSDPFSMTTHADCRG
jgi:hypothetical protein